MWHAKKKIAAQKTGGVLLVVLMAVLIFSVLMVGLFRSVRYTADEASDRTLRSRAFWLAEAGLHEVRGIFTQGQNMRPRILKNFGGLSFTNQVANWGGYQVGVTTNSFSSLGSNAVPPEIVEFSNSTFLALSSTGTTVFGEVAIVEEMLMLSPMQYLIASGEERSSPTLKIWYAGNDFLYGDIFSNDEINIWESKRSDGTKGYPTFFGEVHSSARTFAEYPGLNDNQHFAEPQPRHIDAQVFRDRFIPNQPSFDFKPEWVSDLYEVADQRFTDQQKHRVFFEDQTVYIHLPNGTVQTNTLGSGEGPIFYFNGSVDVRGEVGGNVTIAADGAIYIQGDLVYSSIRTHLETEKYISGVQAEDMYTDPVFSSDRYYSLGLFSRETVTIGNKAHLWEVGETNVYLSDVIDEEGSKKQGESKFKDYTNGDRDHGVNIHAGIFISSEGNGFRAEENNKDIDRPTINLYGSINQYRRGAVAYGTIYGFDKNYVYDPVLRRNAPPGSPVFPPRSFNWRRVK